MQLKNIGFRVPGLYAAASVALKDASMSATAQHRRDTLAFWEKHGLATAMGTTPPSSARTIGRYHTERPHHALNHAIPANHLPYITARIQNWVAAYTNWKSSPKIGILTSISPNFPDISVNPSANSPLKPLKTDSATMTEREKQRFISLIRSNLWQEE